MNEEKLNQVYAERNALAVAFGRAMRLAGCKVWRGEDPSMKLDDDWRHVLYVRLPSGEQVSWHMAPESAPLLLGFPEDAEGWDGTYVARNPSWCRAVNPTLQVKEDATPWVQAFGLMSTLNPTMEIDIKDPIGMATRIVNYVEAERAEANAALGMIDVAVDLLNERMKPMLAAAEELNKKFPGGVVKMNEKFQQIKVDSKAYSVVVEKVASLLRLREGHTISEALLLHDLHKIVNHEVRAQLAQEGVGNG